MFQTIVVPLDGSDRASRALDHALAVAETHDAALHVVCIVDTRLHGEPALSTLELAIDELEDDAHERLANAEVRAAERDVTIVTKCFHGVPHDAIVEYADDVEADLIVMGYRGETHERKMGSVAREVVESSPRPVETVQ